MRSFRRASIILICGIFLSLIWLGCAFQAWQEGSHAETELRLQTTHATARAHTTLAHLKSQIARLKAPEGPAPEMPTSPDEMRQTLLEAAERAGLARVSLNIGTASPLAEGALQAFPIRLTAEAASDLEAFRFWRLVGGDPSCTLRFSKWEMRSMALPPEMMTFTLEGTWVIPRGGIA